MFRAHLTKSHEHWVDRLVQLRWKPRLEIDPESEHCIAVFNLPGLFWRLGWRLVPLEAVCDAMYVDVYTNTSIAYRVSHSLYSQTHMSQAT